MKKFRMPSNTLVLYFLNIVLKSQSTNISFRSTWFQSIKTNPFLKKWKSIECLGSIFFPSMLKTQSLPFNKPSSYFFVDTREDNGKVFFLMRPSGLYYKCFTIVIYDRYDSGQYYKTRIMIESDDFSLS